mmetsp:Transcript_2938/g.6165  ORF Transcript_2938/g.6165 Transcript_2938/m.6165 type:complete len:286 (+) Transcript_2938:877-1734(+)
MQKNEVRDRQPWRAGRGSASATPLLLTTHGPPTCDFRPRSPTAWAGRSSGAQDRLLDKHRRDIAHHRRHCLRRRPWLRQAEGVQPSHPRRVASRLSNLEGFRASAGWPCRAHEARQMLPSLHRESVQEGADGANVPRDSAFQPWFCCSPAEEAWNRRFGALRLHGPARARDAHARPRASELPGRTRRRRQSHRAGLDDGRVPARPAASEDASLLPSALVFQRDALGHLDAQHAKPIHAAKRSGATGGRGEGAVPARRRRPLDAAQRVPRVEEQPGGLGVVLRQLH